MRVLLDVISQNSNDPNSLLRWLNNDPDVYLHCDLRALPKAPEPGSMGVDAQTVEAVFSGAVNLASLVVAIASWKSSRPTNPDVVINLGNRSITLAESTPEEIARIASLLAPEGNEGSSGTQSRE